MRTVLTNKRSKKDSNAAQALDECALDDTGAYKEKMSRWYKDALNGMQDRLMEPTMNVAHITRSPLTHLSAFLKKRRADENPEDAELQELKSADSHMAMLIDGKAQAIVAEFDAMLNSDSELMTVMAEIDSNCVISPAEATALRGLAIKLVLTGSWGLRKRVLDVVESEPLSLLVMAKSNCRKFCKARKDASVKLIARMQDPGRNNVHPTAIKVFTLFKADILNAADHGTFHVPTAKGFNFTNPFWSLMKRVRRFMLADVRENERMNSMLKCISNRCPGISIALLTARLVIKADLGHSLTHNSNKWKVARDAAEALMTKLLAAVERQKLESIANRQDDAGSDCSDVETTAPQPIADNTPTQVTLHRYCANDQSNKFDPTPRRIDFSALGSLRYDAPPPATIKHAHARRAAAKAQLQADVRHVWAHSHSLLLARHVRELLTKRTTPILIEMIGHSAYIGVRMYDRHPQLACCDLDEEGEIHVRRPLHTLHARDAFKAVFDDYRHASNAATRKRATFQIKISQLVFEHGGDLTHARVNQTTARSHHRMYYPVADGRRAPQPAQPSRKQSSAHSSTASAASSSNSASAHTTTGTTANDDEPELVSINL
jgi:hypothetical protein